MSFQTDLRIKNAELKQLENKDLKEIQLYMLTKLKTVYNNDIDKLLIQYNKNPTFNKLLTTKMAFIDNNFTYSKEYAKPSIRERIYCLIHNIHSETDYPKCKCGKFKRFDRKNFQFKLSCGNPYCYQSFEEVNDKRQTTAITNYGSLKEAYHDTMVDTVQQKYGVDNVSKLDEIKQKKIETSLLRYGTDYPWQSEKGKEQQKQGVISKYGVHNISLNPDSITKKLITKDDQFILPSGKTIYIEGYEAVALDFIFKHFNEDDIIIHDNNISIEYSDHTGQIRRWFPDFYIKATNTIIEIKNLYRFINKPVDKYKAHAAQHLGYNCKFIVYDDINRASPFLLELIDITTNNWKYIYYYKKYVKDYKTTTKKIMDAGLIIKEEHKDIINYDKFE